uniref:Uncharacterized protein n=1 Tax=Leishmania guyanensis TaxID=5670 RepID=A0A1E1J207_LEIGU|nr:Hypothetical protein BN36_3051160 [Leishmania guyanensis]
MYRLHITASRHARSTSTTVTSLSADSPNLWCFFDLLLPPPSLSLSLFVRYQTHTQKHHGFSFAGHISSSLQEGSLPLHVRENNNNNNNNNKHNDVVEGTDVIRRCLRLPRLSFCARSPQS